MPNRRRGPADRVGGDGLRVGREGFGWAGEATIKSKFEQLRPVMDERLCRLWAACFASGLSGLQCEVRGALFSFEALEVIEIFEAHHGSECLPLFFKDHRLARIADAIRQLSKVRTRFSGRNVPSHVRSIHRVRCVRNFC